MAPARSSRHDPRGLASQASERRHSAADDTRAEERIERRIDGRPGRAGHEFRGFARVENAAFAVLEIAGREDDGVPSEPAQTLEDRARRETGEELGRHTAGKP